MQHFPPMTWHLALSTQHLPALLTEDALPIEDVALPTDAKALKHTLKLCHLPRKPHHPLPKPCQPPHEPRHLEVPL